MDRGMGGWIAGWMEDDGNGGGGSERSAECGAEERSASGRREIAHGILTS